MGLEATCGTSNLGAPRLATLHSYRQVRQALSPYLFEPEASTVDVEDERKLIQGSRPARTRRYARSSWML